MKAFRQRLALLENHLVVDDTRVGAGFAFLYASGYLKLAVLTLLFAASNHESILLARAFLTGEANSDNFAALHLEIDEACRQNAFQLPADRERQKGDVKTYIQLLARGKTDFVEELHSELKILLGAVPD